MFLAAAGVLVVTLRITAIGTCMAHAAFAGALAGMLLGALGGAMVPGELFEEPISTISQLTPHYWAIDAFRQLVFFDAALTDIVRQLIVLLVYALVLVGIGTWGLRIAVALGVAAGGGGARGGGGVFFPRAAD